MVNCSGRRKSGNNRRQASRGPVTNLDGPVDQDVESAWDAEIKRRIAEIDSGNLLLIDREEFRNRVRERTNRT